MSFLIALLTSFLGWLAERLAVLGLSKVKEEQEKKALEERARADAEAIKKAQTDKEREDAVKRIIDNTFRP